MMKIDMKGPLAVFFGLGFEVVALIVGAVYVGSFLDERYALNGVGTLALILLATAGWMLHVFVLLRQLNNQPRE